MAWFYEHIYTVCWVIFIISIMGAPFICPLFCSIIYMLDNWYKIKNGLRVGGVYCGRRLSNTEFTWECLKFVMYGIPVWATIICLVFAYGAYQHR